MVMVMIMMLMLMMVVTGKHKLSKLTPRLDYEYSHTHKNNHQIQPILTKRTENTLHTEKMSEGNKATRGFRELLIAQNIAIEVGTRF